MTHSALGRWGTPFFFAFWSSSLAFGQCEADLNGNAIIDNDDLLILLADYGRRVRPLGTILSFLKSTTTRAPNRGPTAITNSLN